jgi:hypothetical protein
MILAPPTDTRMHSICASGSGDRDALPSRSSRAVTREDQRLPEFDAELPYGTASDETIHGGARRRSGLCRRGNDVVGAGAGGDLLFGEDGDDAFTAKTAPNFCRAARGMTSSMAGASRS